MGKHMTSNVKLLPLPEPVEFVFAAHDNEEGYGMATAGKCYYTPDQVRDYARANLSPLQAEVSDLMQAAGMLAVERAEFRIRAERLAGALREIERRMPKDRSGPAWIARILAHEALNPTAAQENDDA